MEHLAAKISNNYPRDYYIHCAPPLSDDPGAVLVLLELLNDRDAKIRCKAALGLSKIGPNAVIAVSALRELLADKEKGVRFAAYIALVYIDPATHRFDEIDIEPSEIDFFINHRRS